MANARVGKGQRVAGVFFVLLGGGVVLESTWRWLGGMGVAVGAALLIWGFSAMRGTQTPPSGDEVRK